MRNATCWFLIVAVTVARTAVLRPLWAGNLDVFPSGLPGRAAEFRARHHVLRKDAPRRQ